MCYDPIEEERLVDICIAGMLFEYHLYLENFQITSFKRLVEFARKTTVLSGNPPNAQPLVLPVSQGNLGNMKTRKSKQLLLKK